MTRVLGDSLEALGPRTATTVTGTRAAAFPGPRLVRVRERVVSIVFQLLSQNWTHQWLSTFQEKGPQVTKD